MHSAESRIGRNKCRRGGALCCRRANTFRRRQLVNTVSPTSIAHSTSVRADDEVCDVVEELCTEEAVRVYICIKR